MKRRNFIAGLVGAAAALRPFRSLAQRPQRSVPLVGVIWIGAASAQIPVRFRDALLRGLREHSEGQNIAIEHRYYGDGAEQSMLRDCLTHAAPRDPKAFLEMMRDPARPYCGRTRRHVGRRTHWRTVRGGQGEWLPGTWRKESPNIRLSVRSLGKLLCVG